MEKRWFLLLAALIAVSAAAAFVACAGSSGDDDDATVDDDTVDDDGVLDDDATDDDQTDDDVTDDDMTDDDVTDDDVTDDDAAAAPKYPSNHGAGWDCYLCHATAFMSCATAEPHGHVYTAPSQCLTCHSAAATSPAGCGPVHTSANCFNCHGSSHHGKTFANYQECRACHH